MTVAACAEIVRRGDPERFRAAMAAPPAARPVLFPIYACGVEIARAAWVTQEPMIAEMRLQWWRDTLSEIAAGGRPRAHEVADPLAAVLDAEGAGLLGRAAEARSWDAWREPFADVDALCRYVDDTAAGPAWAAARALGSGTEAAVRALGRAGGLARFLRAVPALSALGRHPLPVGADIASLARSELRSLDAARPDRPGRVAGLVAWNARPVLKRASSDPGRVEAGTLGPSAFADRLGLIRAALTGRV